MVEKSELYTEEEDLTTASEVLSKHPIEKPTVCVRIQCNKVGSELVRQPIETVEERSSHMSVILSKDRIIVLYRIRASIKEYRHFDPCSTKTINAVPL